MEPGTVASANVVALSWPAAVALIATVVAITAAILKLFLMGRSTITTESLQKDISTLYDRVGTADQKIVGLETSVEKTVAAQITDLKDGMRRMEDKMDTLVKEVISALSALK